MVHYGNPTREPQEMLNMIMDRALSHMEQLQSLSKNVCMYTEVISSNSRARRIYRLTIAFFKIIVTSQSSAKETLIFLNVSSNSNTVNPWLNISPE